MFIALTTVVNAFKCFLSSLMLKTAKLECWSLASLPSLTQYLHVLLEPVQIEQLLGTHFYGKLLAYLTIFPLGQKGLLGTNTLAYLSVVTKEKWLIAFRTFFNALKLFLSLLMLMVSQSAGPWQAFPALHNICKYCQSLSKQNIIQAHASMASFFAYLTIFPLCQKGLLGTNTLAYLSGVTKKNGQQH